MGRSRFYPTNSLVTSCRLTRGLTRGAFEPLQLGLRAHSRAFEPSLHEDWIGGIKGCALLEYAAPVLCGLCFGPDECSRVRWVGSWFSAGVFVFALSALKGWRFESGLGGLLIGMDFAFLSIFLSLLRTDLWRRLLLAYPSLIPLPQSFPY